MIKSVPIREEFPQLREAIGLLVVAEVLGLACGSHSDSIDEDPGVVVVVGGVSVFIVFGEC
jgi:hypothetical protein